MGWGVNDNQTFSYLLQKIKKILTKECLVMGLLEKKNLYPAKLIQSLILF